MIQFLAEAEPMIPGSWVTSFVSTVIVAAIGAIGAIWMKSVGKKQGIAEATNNVTIQHPVPEIPFRKVPTTVSWSDHTSLSDRVKRLEEKQEKMREEQGQQFLKILESGQERELRLMEKLDQTAREIHSRLDVQFGPKPRRTGQ